MDSFLEVGGSYPRETAVLDGSQTETFRKENRQPGSQRVIRARIYSVHSRMTRQLPKNDSWKLTSTGTKIQEYVDKLAVIAFFSDLPLAIKIKRKKKTTFPTHPVLDFALSSQFTLNFESQQLNKY